MAGKAIDLVVPVIPRPHGVVVCVAGGYTFSPEGAEALAAQLIAAAYDARKLRHLVETEPKSIIVRA